MRGFARRVTEVIGSDLIGKAGGSLLVAFRNGPAQIGKVGQAWSVMFRLG